MFVGLSFLIIGNGFFKPNISSIVGQLYKTEGKDKDAGYTIFYMGINSGAFLGILLCGYIGENINWHYGFGLAGIFMLLGGLQFYYSQKIFGEIGLLDNNRNLNDDTKDQKKEEIDDNKTNSKVIIDRLIVIVIFSFSTIFFWWAFEQAGGSMTIFASDYTDRNLIGQGAFIFKVFNSLITIIPLIIITYILYLLYIRTSSSLTLSNTFLIISFVIIWIIVLWMLGREFENSATKIPSNSITYFKMENFGHLY